MAHSANRLTRTYLPSDPNFLLDYMAGIASDDSDDDFDGYLLSDHEPEGTVATNTFIIYIINFIKYYKALFIHKIMLYRRETRQLQQQPEQLLPRCPLHP